MAYFSKKASSILVVMSIVIISQVARAQEKPFKFGFKLAPAISWLSPDSKNYDPGGSSFAFAWGFVADITLMEHYYLATGFNVSYFKGNLVYPHLMKDEEGIPHTGTMNETYNLRYIEVPLAIKMKTNTFGNNFIFFGLIGFNTGINIRAKSDLSFSSSTYKFSDEKVDTKDNTTLFKTSLLVGAGTEYVIDESVSLIFGINFNNGLTNVLKGNNTVDTDIETKAIPYYFEFNLGVIF